MTAGPKKLPKPENRMPELVEGAAEQFCHIQNSAADLEREELLALGRSIGHLEFATFIGNISDAGMLSSYETIKKSKAWKALRSKATGEIFPNIDSFCQEHFGYSERRLRQITGNREAIGQEAFEQAERLGLRQADYNLIKALPAPKQEIVKEALAEGASKEDLQRAIRELAAADQKEIEALGQERDATAKKLAETEANYEKQGELIAGKDKKLNELALQLSQKRIQTVSPDEEGAALRQEASQIAYAAEAELRGNLKKAFEALAAHTESQGIPHDDFMAGLLCQVELAVRQLRGEFDIKASPDGEELPLWMQEGASDAAATAVAAELAANGWALDEAGRMVPANKKD